jgi:hypothetical protein
MLTVTMQLNVGINEAGDWANRSAGKAASGTRLRDLAAPQDELLIRLHSLRGAVEAMQGEPHGTSVTDTATHRNSVNYGDPSLYRGLGFLLPGLD